MGGFEKLFIFKEHVTFVGLLFSQLFLTLLGFTFIVVVLWYYGAMR